MTQPFKFRYVNEITGVFVLLALGLLVAGIFFAGHAQGYFEPKFRLLIEFVTEEGSFGLQKGADVRIRDAVAGTVESIIPSTDGVLKATLVIKESFHPFVRANSKALVKKALIITGDSYIDISSGNMSEPLMPDGSVIKCSKDTQIIEQATKLIEDIHTNTIPILIRLKVVLDEIGPLAVQAKKTMREGELVLHDNVPGVLIQAQDTMRSAQVTIEALQRHWLLRKYVEPADSGIIAPAAIRLPDEQEQTRGGSK